MRKAHTPCPVFPDRGLVRRQDALVRFLLLSTDMAAATTRFVAGACICLACFLATSARADERSLSTEIRAGVFAPSFRWSNRLPAAATFVNNAEKSLYFVPSLGARFYARRGHGGTIDLDYRFDSDTDSTCLFALSTCPATFQIDFAVVHTGYAYRHIVESPKSPYRRAWAFTPHVSLATGVAISEHIAAGIPARSPVVGGRIGFDIDLHLQRFFLGWSFSYEILGHTRGSIRYSQFFSWNAIPVFRIGGVIGRRVQKDRPAPGYPILP